MIEIKNLTIKTKDKYIVKKLSITINQNDKLAIIGEEGNGKTTLLKTLIGIQPYTSIEGTINTNNKKIGYLPQIIDIKDFNQKVQNYLFENEDDYYNKINELYIQLKKLNINNEILNQQIKTLSGGEKTKIIILKILLEQPDVILLDEPTNDLDIETLKWLENFIINEKKPIIYISHDETLLENTANMILHLEQIKNKQDVRHSISKTPYNEYINNRINEINKTTILAKKDKRDFKKKQEKLLQIMNAVEYKQNTISRKDPFGAAILKRKMHTLKHQEQKLYSQELRHVPDVEEHIIFSFCNTKLNKTKNVIDLNINKLMIANKILSTNIKLNVTGNKKVIIIGNNGVGKSTLLKEIYKSLIKRSDILVGYMPQNYHETLDNNKTPIEYLNPSTKEEITKYKTALGNMKITPDEMQYKFEELSEGTKAKIILTKLILEGCNILLLDEPTRNLSPLSNPVIRKALKEFNGCIISVSHDRKFINEVATDIYELTSNGLFPKQKDS